MCTTIDAKLNFIIPRLPNNQFTHAHKFTLWLRFQMVNDYLIISNVTENNFVLQEFHLSILEECIVHGCQATQNRYTSEKQLNSPDSVEDASADSPEATLDPLFQAAQLTMFRHINNVINMLPVPHQLLVFSENCTAKEKRYREKIEYYFSDTAWYETVFHLVSALLQYLISMSIIPWQPELPADVLQDICRFSIMCTEVSDNENVHLFAW